MALITNAADASLDVSTAQFAPQITGLYAGEDIPACSPCYIKSSDGKLYLSNGTAANEAAEFAGVSPRSAKAGQPLTVFGLGARFRLSTGLTPGDLLYIGATAGRWDTSATTGDASGTLQVLTSTDVRVVRVK